MSTAPLHIRRMTVADIPQVRLIDRLSFPIPWSRTAYQYELTENPAAHFIVAAGPAGPGSGGWLERLKLAPARPDLERVVGYAGYWLVADEAHIGTLAVHPEQRGRGAGEQLLLTLLDHAVQAGARLATLEVRVSNQAARELYRKHGFEEVGRRKHYYRDNREDALLLTVHLDPAWQARLRAGAGTSP